MMSQSFSTRSFREVASIRIPRRPVSEQPSVDDAQIWERRSIGDLQGKEYWKRGCLVLRVHVVGTLPSTIQGVELASANTLADVISILEQINSLHSRAWRIAENKSRRSQLPFGHQPVLLRLDTSESFTLYLIAAAPLVALVYWVLRLGFGLLERGVKVRKEWHEGTKAKFDALKAEAELKNLERQLEIPRLREEEELQLVAEGSRIMAKLSRKGTSNYEVALKEVPREGMSLLVAHGVDGGRQVDLVSIRTGEPN